eukprot:TRINITY_DN5070_c1_g3_i1.p1 TRINITY_DN5070_c1_g3~~TRINITY_DN5070_c1_g3_i1.p1  ORF type:complete len:616 (-),score=93.07 TRINITY_DN5070_c1_g3_i1:87-1934(-)
MAMIVQPTMPTGPRDMSALFAAGTEIDTGAPKTTKVALVATASGVAALMQAYACIGIDTETARALIADAHTPPKTKPRPMWESENEKLLQRLLATATDGNGGTSDAPTSALQAALLAAAATNSDPQTTMALIAAATAANSAADYEEYEARPPAPENDPAPPPPADEPELPAPAVAQVAEFRISPAESKSGVAGDAKPAGLRTTNLQSLMEASKAKEEAQAAVASISGYARAAMTSRIAENLSKSAASATVASFSLGGEKSKDKGIEGGAKVFIGGIPRGTSEGLIMVECRKLGSVLNVFYDTNANSLFDSSWALVTFSTLDEAHTAVRRLSQRVALFGASQPLEVRLGMYEDEERMFHAKASLDKPVAAAESAWPFQLNEDPSGKKAKKRSRSRRRKRDKRRRRRSSSRSSGSGSSDAGEAPKRVAPTPVPPDKHKIRGSGGFDAVSTGPNAEAAMLPVAPAGAAPNANVPVPSMAEMPTGGRQVGVRGSWAEFATTAGRNYYVNVVTGEKTWARPVDYNVQGSQRGGQVSANGIPTGHSNLFVGSIPPNCTDAIFRQMFAPFGQIISMKCVPEKSHGFVKFSNCAEAQKAIDTMNGAMINGTPLNVKFANMAAH